jgi:hypothetical protein
VANRRKLTFSDVLGWLAGIGFIVFSLSHLETGDYELDRKWQVGAWFGFAFIMLISWARKARNEASDDMDEAKKAAAEAERVRQEASWERESQKMPPASAASSYAILELNENATDTEIKNAFRKLVKRYHPDRSKYSAQTNAEKFRQIQEAYAVLRDHRGFSGH